MISAFPLSSVRTSIGVSGGRSAYETPDACICAADIDSPGLRSSISAATTTSFCSSVNSLPSFTKCRKFSFRGQISAKSLLKAIQKLENVEYLEFDICAISYSDLKLISEYSAMTPTLKSLHFCSLFFYPDPSAKTKLQSFNTI